jgi:hypothetical protein
MTHILTVHPVIALPVAVRTAVALQVIALPAVAHLPVHQVMLPVLMVLEDTAARCPFIITTIAITIFE